MVCMQSESKVKCLRLESPMIRVLVLLLIWVPGNR